MQNSKHTMQWSFIPLILSALMLAGCQSGKTVAASTPAPVAAPAAPATPAAPDAPVVAAPKAPEMPATPAAPAEVTAAAAVANAALPVRIKAGSSTPVTDADGNVWLPDQGFADGDTIARADDLQIAGTASPALYRTERYSMTSFSFPLPNGKYIVKLHFAETYEGISGPGGRIFSFAVEGKEFKDFDVWVKSGGAQHAYIETVPVEINDGKLNITFTPNIENPEINAIEIWQDSGS